MRSPSRLRSSRTVCLMSLMCNGRCLITWYDERRNVVSLTLSHSTEMPEISRIVIVPLMRHTWSGSSLKSRMRARRSVSFGWYSSPMPGSSLANSSSIQTSSPSSPSTRTPWRRALSSSDVPAQALLTLWCSALRLPHHRTREHGLHLPRHAAADAQARVHGPPAARGSSWRTSPTGGHSPLGDRAEPHGTLAPGTPGAEARLAPVVHHLPGSRVSALRLRPSAALNRRYRTCAVTAALSCNVSRELCACFIGSVCRESGADDATIEQCWRCHTTDHWNNIVGVGLYKHH